MNTGLINQTSAGTLRAQFATPRIACPTPRVGSFQCQHLRINLSSCPLHDLLHHFIACFGIGIYSRCHLRGQHYLIADDIHRLVRLEEFIDIEIKRRTDPLLTIIATLPAIAQELLYMLISLLVFQKRYRSCMLNNMCEVAHPYSFRITS
ncbi:unknown [Porphyromonas sp. CAG:1061]|nr:unknown [Porphyromonas sp. CAG:1061]